MHGIRHANGLVNSIQSNRSGYVTAQRDSEFPDAEVIEIGGTFPGGSGPLMSIAIENGKHRLGPHTAMIEAQTRKDNLRAQADNALKRAKYQRMRAIASAADKAVIDELIAELG